MAIEHARRHLQAPPNRHRTQIPGRLSGKKGGILEEAGQVPRSGRKRVGARFGASGIGLIDGVIACFFRVYINESVERSLYINFTTTLGQETPVYVRCVEEQEENVAFGEGMNENPRDYPQQPPDAHEGMLVDVSFRRPIGRRPPPPPENKRNKKNQSRRTTNLRRRHHLQTNCRRLHRRLKSVEKRVVSSSDETNLRHRLVDCCHPFRAVCHDSGRPSPNR